MQPLPRFTTLCVFSAVLCARLCGASTPASQASSDWAGSDAQLLYIRFRFECPSGYARISSVNSEQPSRECEQAATYLGLNYDTLYSNSSAVDAAGDAVGDTGCYVNRSLLYYVPPLLADAQIASEGRGIVLLCKRLPLPPSTPAPCDCPLAPVALSQSGGDCVNMNGVILLGVSTLLYLILGLPIVFYCIMKRRDASGCDAVEKNCRGVADRDSNASNLEAAAGNSPLSADPPSGNGSVRFSGQASIACPDPHFPRLLPQALPAPSSSSDSSFFTHPNYSDLSKKVPPASSLRRDS